MPTRVLIEDIKNIIKDNETIVLGMAASEPQYFISKLGEINKSVTLINCLALSPYTFNPHVHIKSFFYSSVLRQYKASHIQYLPTHLRHAGNIITSLKSFIYIGAASIQNKDGMVSLSLSSVYEYEAFKHARIKILELSVHMPFTFGKHLVHISDIDYIVESHRMPYTLPDVMMDARDTIIAKHIADLIEDGSTLQFGIGAIPNAVAHYLKNKKDLGIHTEMFSDGFMDLIQSGAVTGLKKTIHTGKHTCSFALGSKALYTFLDNHPDVEFLQASYVNDPAIIGKNYKQVSINTTIEIDLSGQCNSETLKGIHYSGTGGQSDTAVGAQLSIGGKSFIGLHSTSTISTKDGKKQTVSKIVSSFKNGSSVSLSRNDVDYVVTEFGVVRLKGLTLKERAHQLISIAHPDFQGALKEEVKSQFL